MARFPVAILAYGSLITDPGAELSDWLVALSDPLPTPFAVEYGRTTRRRGGAPTLTAVPAGGAPVAARLLLLQPPDAATVIDALYRREINRVGDTALRYDDRRERAAADGATIERADASALDTDALQDGATVLYAALPANFTEINDVQRPVEQKAQLLAERAIASVDATTYPAGRDGIRYLADAIAAGIRTPLTPAYRAAILRITDSATLSDARAAIWRKRDKR